MSPLVELSLPSRGVSRDEPRNVQKQDVSGVCEYVKQDNETEHGYAESVGRNIWTKLESGEGASFAKIFGKADHVEDLARAKSCGIKRWSNPGSRRKVSLAGREKEKKLCELRHRNTRSTDAYQKFYP